MTRVAQTGLGTISAIILILPSLAGIAPQGAGRRHHTALQNSPREFGTQCVPNSWKGPSRGSFAVTECSKTGRSPSFTEQVGVAACSGQVQFIIHDAIQQ